MRALNMQTPNKAASGTSAARGLAARLTGSPRSWFGRRGYTMVEVMMGLSVLAIGATGIIAMQKYALMGTMTSRNVMNATNIAASSIEKMSSEAAIWADNGTQDTVAMPWLGPALNTPNVWVVPPDGAALIDGTPLDIATIDLAANPVTPVGYCTHVRAELVGNKNAIPPSDPLLGGTDSTDIARVEVRTFFAKSGRNIACECQTWTATETTDVFDDVGTNTCGNATEPRTRGEYGVIYMTTILRRGGG